MGRVKRCFHRLLSWCPLYQIALGGYRYYHLSEERRFEPCRFLSFGKGARVCTDVDIIAPEKVHVGDGAFIAPGCLIYAVGGFHLGNYSGLGSGTTILTIEHRHAGAEAIPFDDVRMVKPVYIEDYVWVGMNVSVLPGVRIGEGAIIGLGSVVTKDVPPLAIAMGNPAVVIGHRRKETFERLKAEGAIRPVSMRVNQLWVPPLTRRKYGEDLARFGFDTSNGQEFFIYERSSKP